MHLPSLLCSENRGSRLASVQSLFLPSLTLHQESLQDPLALLEFQSPVCLRNSLLLVTMHLLPCSSALLSDPLISILYLTCQSCSLLLVSLGLHFHFLSLKDILWVNKFLNYICEVTLFAFSFFIWLTRNITSDCTLASFQNIYVILGMLFKRMALREQREATPRFCDF